MDDSIKITRQKTFGLQPARWQTDAAASTLNGKDTVVIAGTGYGKSLVCMIHLCMRPAALVVIVSLLKALQSEQVSRLAHAGIEAIAVNEGTISGDLLAQVESENTRALFISPEMLFSPHRRQNLWRRVGVRNRLSLVVVDEAHVVAEWGSPFRKAYGKLGDFRSWISPKVPWLCLSATLPKMHMEHLSKTLRLGDETVVINVGNERTNVKLYVKKMEKAASTFQDLRFLKHNHQKVIIYVNTRLDAQKMATFLLSLGKPCVVAYHATKSEERKQQVMGEVRAKKEIIFCATEAAGMGSDIPDIDVVIQYDLPHSLDRLIQRIGRVARSPTKTGIGLLLAWMVHSRSGAPRTHTKRNK